jgi:hypothetical protein
MNKWRYVLFCLQIGFLVTFLLRSGLWALQLIVLEWLLIVVSDHRRQLYVHLLILYLRSDGSSLRLFDLAGQIFSDVQDPFSIIIKDPQNRVGVDAGDRLYSVFEFIERFLLLIAIAALLGRGAFFHYIAIYFDGLVKLVLV